MSRTATLAPAAWNGATGRMKKGPRHANDVQRPPGRPNHEARQTQEDLAILLKAGLLVKRRRPDGTWGYWARKGPP